ncbi:hypothetical protein LCGC14_2290200, partial [marine sediment metagenome]
MQSMQIRRRNNLSSRQKWILTLLLAVPLALALAKLLGLPGAAFLAREVSLARLAEDM